MKGALPPALLCAALGFAVAFWAPRQILAALIILTLTAVAASLLPLAADREIVFAGLWISTALTAATVHLTPRAAVLPVLLAFNAGGWAGAAIAVGGAPADVARALPAALVALPTAWLVAHGGGIAVKIVASWLIAVAILAATLPMVATPGYVDDHRG